MTAASEPSGADRLVIEFFRRWPRPWAPRNSIEAYRRDLTASFESLAEKNVHFTNCTADHLRELLAEWHGAGLSSRSVARRLSALRQMMGWLVEERIREDNPCRWIDNPKQPSSLPKSLSEAEIAALIAAAGQLPSKSRSLRMMAMLELLYATGLRVSELVTLPIDQFDVTCQHCRHRQGRQGKAGGPWHARACRARRLDRGT